MSYIIQLIDSQDPDQPMYFKRLRKDYGKVLTDQPDCAAHYSDENGATVDAELLFSGWTAYRFQYKVVPRTDHPVEKEWILERDQLRKLI